MPQPQKFELKSSMKAVVEKIVSECSVCFLYKSVHSSSVIQQGRK